MRWLNQIACLATLTVYALTIGGVVVAEDAKTGGFETKFTERSPLSEIKSLTERLKVLKAGEKVEGLQDYDLSTEGWWVYVPEKYDPSKPMGLFVLALYKHADSLPTPIVSQLADANMALVVPKEYLDTWWKRAGLMLDAAYNMQKIYKIDPKRVYIFGGGDWADADGTKTSVGSRIALFYPDVFTGAFTSNDLLLYRPATSGNLMWEQQIPSMEMAQRNLARTHPWVIGGQLEGDFQKVVREAYKADGFEAFKYIPVSTEQYHYPNFTTDWIPEVLKYMDSVTADLKLPADGMAVSADEPKTGGFEIKFTERNPLSEIKSLTKRLKVLKAGEKVEGLQDYDLSKEEFLVYVPEKYDPAKPPGLIVLALYKEAGILPMPVLPQLDEANVSLVVPKQYLDTWWKRAGLMLDAAYNMQKLYKIDPKRVYLFGSFDWADGDGSSTSVGLRMGLFYPEVFTGTFMAGNLMLYRPARMGNLTWQQQIPRMEIAQGNLARAHPLVVGSYDDSDNAKAVISAYKADGFKNLKHIPVSTEQYHYPNFTTDWIPEVLKYMDGVTADLKLPADAAGGSSASAPRKN
jgi:hypothetical protein